MAEAYLSPRIVRKKTSSSDMAMPKERAYSGQTKSVTGTFQNEPEEETDFQFDVEDVDSQETDPEEDKAYISNQMELTIKNMFGFG